MKILFVLTYFRPHVSGLTIYVDRLARAMARRGHTVTVLTSQYDSGLAREEWVEGVRILRVPVLIRVSKGVIMPTLGIEAWRQVRTHDVVSLHLPQFDAAGIAVRGKLLRKPAVLTYHCDLRLPDGLVNRIVNLVVQTANTAAGLVADAVVAYTEDYATHSPFISRYLSKVRIIPPPVEVAEITAAQQALFEKRLDTSKRPIIGIAARLATEKGVEYLMKALPLIQQRYPDAHVLFAGQNRDVMGEEEYARSLQPLLKDLSESWTFLGVLDPQEMAAFFSVCDITVLPSVNSTESFGLVQIESMICGTPVVASDLPGVRQPIYQTEMGEVVPIRRFDLLAEAILKILDNKPAYIKDQSEIRERFSSDSAAQKYEELFMELIKEKGEKV
ncbi:MAG: glycosyltransferase family 4 protein [Anaerolineales bacterium]|nr:glycosyltransferase family 4 protein [Anaerolineales bacterium]